MHVARCINASQPFQSSLYALKKHFHEELHTLVESVYTMASYLHRSFLSIAQYKRPYNPSNPYGIAVNVSCKIKGALDVGDIVIDTFKMATMGMLLVATEAMFSTEAMLKAAMFMASLNDDVYGKPTLLLPTDEVNIVETMRNLRKDMGFDNTAVTLVL